MIWELVKVAHILCITWLDIVVAALASEISVYGIRRITQNSFLSSKVFFISYTEQKYLGAAVEGKWW